MKYRYLMIQSEFPHGESTRVGYGVAAVVNYDETAVVLSSFSDVCSEAELLLPLIETCNSLQLDPIHLADVVDDFLGSL